MKQLYLISMLCIFNISLHSSYAMLDISFAEKGFTFNNTQTPIWTTQDQICTAMQTDDKFLIAEYAIEANTLGGTQLAILRFNSDFQ